MLGRIFGLIALVLVLAAPVARATPVATNPVEEQLLGRVFPEPDQSVNYLQFDPHGGQPSEFAGGMAYLAQKFPRYLTVSTVADELHDPAAVSVGADGIPAGRPGDTGDGRPFYVLTVTDRTVPDAGKHYAVLMFAHSLETCGREGAARAVEDLLRAVANPAITYTDGTGLGGTHTFTAAEVLRRVKLYVVAGSPDGWAKGDITSRYDQYTGGGLNSNRVAYQPGWIFQDKTLAAHGYRTATEPEGLGPATFLQQVRRQQLGGRPFTVGLDIHGPLPTSLIIDQDHGTPPADLVRVSDLGRRYQQAMDAVFASYASAPGAAGYSAAAAAAQRYRDAVRAQTPGLLDPFGGASVGNMSGLNATVNTVGDYPLQWATPGDAFDTIGYDASSTWSGFMASELGASAHTIEANCAEQAPYVPATMQLYVDNVRASIRTMLAAAAAGAPRVPKVDLGGRVGYVYDRHRVTSAHNASPVPKGFPGTPVVAQIEQTPYDVADTDYFKALGQVARQRPVAVRSARLPRALRRLRTLVIPGRQVDPRPLKAWVRAGHNLVLTDSALQMLPKLGIGSAADVQRSFGYVGYADFDRNVPLASGLPLRARETYDPVALGLPLLMERDGYWHCASGESPGCASGTQNSAPIWTVDRRVVDAIKGASVAGTADPPATRRTTREGSATTRAEVFAVPYGKGRIVALGALLPRPSDTLPHAFGLQGYALTTAAQTVLLRAMTWPPAATRARVPAASARATTTRGGAIAPSAVALPQPVAAPDAAARAYVAAMLGHHRQGIAIARAAAATSSRAAVRSLAVEMILAQEAEIAQLTALRAAWAPGRAPMVAMRGMASDAALRGLRLARGAAADARFVAIMSRHHRGAIAMSRALLRRSHDPDVRAIAASVVRTQAAELRSLRLVGRSAGQAAPFAGAAGI